MEQIKASETPEQKEARLKKAREDQAIRKAQETPEQREARLEKDKIKARERRAEKRDLN